MQLRENGSSAAETLYGILGLLILGIGIVLYNNTWGVRDLASAYAKGVFISKSCVRTVKSTYKNWVEVRDFTADIINPEKNKPALLVSFEDVATSAQVYGGAMPRVIYMRLKDPLEPGRGKEYVVSCRGNSDATWFNNLFELTPPRNLWEGEH